MKNSTYHSERSPILMGLMLLAPIGIIVGLSFDPELKSILLGEAADEATYVRLIVGITVSMLFGIGLPVWLVMATYYRFEPQRLFIRSGPLFRVVPYSEISEVSPSRSIQSSPALSFDRIKIRYGKRSVLISPERRSHFLRELGTRCPQAKIQLK